MCPDCDEALVQAPKLIRCMQCGQQASSELVICPGCGRELRAASSRIVTAVAPVVAAVFLLLFVGLQARNSGLVTGLQSRLSQGIVMLEGLGQQLEPEVVIVMTPIAEDGDNVITDSVVPGNGQGQTTAVAMSLVTPTATLSTAANEIAALGVGGMSQETRDSLEAAATLQAATEVSPQVNAAPTATLTSIPTSTPTPQPPAATATQSPPTPTPTHESAGLAAALGQQTGSEPADAGSAAPAPTSTPDAPAAEAGIASVASVSQAGDGALPTPTRTPTPVAYQVRSGDTLISIAADYGVTVDALMAANGIDERGAYVMQPGKLLIIPQSPGTNNSTQSGETPDAGDGAGETAVETRVDAPVLLLPSDGATLNCSEATSLSWQRVQFVKDSDKYLLHLGFVNGQNRDNGENVTWVLSQPHPVTQTSWQMDSSLCDLAPESSGSQWRWWVEVVVERDGEYVSVSPPSVTRTFSWE